jgi:hypothetical protein
MEIAKACGWHCVGQVLDFEPHGFAPWQTIPTAKELIDRTALEPGPIPDYLNDLNAMHKAVMTLSFDDRTNFRKNLQYMIAPQTKPGMGLVLMSKESYDLWFFATAAQRAEAFLRTIGKWEDEP